MPGSCTATTGSTTAWSAPTTEIHAVVDWEMATLGDTRTDLALMLVYDELPRRRGGDIVSDVAKAPGYPSNDQQLAAYAAAVAGARRPGPEMNWHMALAYFKLAVILEGIHYRYLQGQTVGEGFDRIGARVRPDRRRRPRRSQGRLKEHDMDFALDARTQELREQLLDFMARRSSPPSRTSTTSCPRWTTRSPGRPLRCSGSCAPRPAISGCGTSSCPDTQYGAGLTNLQYAPLAEITGRAGHLAPPALNCAAPDTGNMEVLAMFGSRRAAGALAHAPARRAPSARRSR